MHTELDFSRVLDYRGRFSPPCYATRNAAGLDLRAELTTRTWIGPGQRRLIPTGLWLQLPENTEMQVRPRSGLALKHGVTVLNSPGTVDADYRDEVQVLLINTSTTHYCIEPGAKIAQGVFSPVWRAVQGFTSETKERAGGFGSTGH